MLYRERMRQANKEARATAIGVGVVLVCWFVFGFGLYDVDIQIFSTPLWIVMGCLGTWIVAIIVAIVLATRVIEDCPLDEDDFGREYQIEDPTPVEVVSMTVDLDIMKDPTATPPAKKKEVTRKSVHPRKPIANHPRNRKHEGRNTRS